MSEPEILLDARLELGEGPAWHARTQTLYWVDITGKQLHSLKAKHRTLEVDDYIGSVAPCKDGSLVAAIGRRLCRVDPETGAVTTLATPDEPTTNRFNDGKCDPAGRFLAGTMDLAHRSPSGSLYSLEPGGGLTRLLDGIRISNGLAWSPDHATMYYIDTPTREVKAFDYDVETGELAFRRVAIRVPKKLGSPDGMTSDTDGLLWIGMWRGASVTRWDPKSGQLLEQIPVPALNVTSVAFGGGDMQVLYITTARQGVDEAALRKYPHSGAVFQLQTSVVGMPTFEFGG